MIPLTLHIPAAFSLHLPFYSVPSLHCDALGNRTSLLFEGLGLLFFLILFSHDTNLGSEFPSHPPTLSPTPLFFPRDFHCFSQSLVPQQQTQVHHSST